MHRNERSVNGKKSTLYSAVESGTPEQVRAILAETGDPNVSYNSYGR